MRKEPVTEDRGRPTKSGGWLFLTFETIPLFLLLCVAQASAAVAAPAATPKTVLVLFSFSDRTLTAYGDDLKSAIRSGVPSPVDFHVEYIESRRFDDQNYEKSLVKTLRATYAATKLDLVLVDAYPALEFALRHRNDLFPSQPIVFFDVYSRRIAGMKMWPEVTGVTEEINVRGTIELALRLHPGTNTVAVITNNSEFERYWLGVVHGELLRQQDKLTEIDLVGVPPSQLLEKVAALPPHSVVLFQESPLDSSQPALGTYDVLALIGQRVPTYCIFPIVCLNRGGIGGDDLDVAEQVSLTAQVVRRVLAGEPPDSIPVVHGTSDTIKVDWHQLRHWNISEAALPPGSVVLHRDPTFWEREKKYIIVAVVLIAVQSLLIVGLLMQRARKHKAEAVLRESEKRFRVMADTTPSLIWMCDQEAKITYLNDRQLAFTGRSPNADYSDTWTAYVHPDDQKGVLDAISRALKEREPFSREYRLLRNDGVYRWMFDVASPRTNGDGSFAGLIGSAIDITDQRMAQEALENMSGRLIEAQEKERSRIARDLHDDVCQRLALLSMELAQANRNGAPPSTKKHLEEIRQHCAEITSDLQSLSHQLHSSRLEYLGVVAAIMGFSKEFAKQHKVSIEFRDENVPTHLSKDVSLCLFRVAQEALHNAVKYSGSSRFSVELRARGDEVVLVVSDPGTGFDVDEAKRNRGGLGLLSMQERIHLVHGQFEVESKRGAGTRVVAIVPVRAVRDESLSGADSDESASATGAA